MTKAKPKVTASKKASRSTGYARAKSASATPDRRRAKTPAIPARKKEPPSTLPGRRDSKQASVLGMLASEGGATIDAIVKTTSWQPHSVRGFFAGVVRKKLKLDLVSQRLDGVRTYRIANQHSTGEPA